jgi:hypothetical protein
VIDARHFEARELRRAEPSDLAFLLLGSLDARVVPDSPLHAIAETEGEDALILVAAVFSTAVRSGAETAFERQCYADLKDELSVTIALDGTSIVHEKQAEDACAWLKPLHLRGAKLASDQQTARAWNRDPLSLLKSLRIERDVHTNGTVRYAFPTDVLLVAVFKSDLDFVIVRVPDVDLDGVTLARG